MPPPNVPIPTFDFLTKVAHLLVNGRVQALVGLVVVGLIMIVNRVRRKVWSPSFAGVMSAFMSGVGLPAGLVLIVYSFTDPAPDLTQMIWAVPLAGIGAVWVSASSIRAAMSPPETENGEPEK